MPRSLVYAVLALALAPLASPAGPLPPTWSARAESNVALFPDGATGVFAVPVVNWSLAEAGSPDRASGLDFGFAVEVRDNASGEAAALPFAGTLFGTYWRDGADLGATFTGPTTQAAELGGTRYAVSLVGFESPTGSGEGGAGRILAQVGVDGQGEPTQPGPTPPVEEEPVSGPVGTPEPATLVLALLGLPALGVVRLARRKSWPGALPQVPWEE